MDLQSSRLHSMDPHRCPEITRDPPLRWGWRTWYTMPSWPHRSTTHLVGVPRLVRWYGSIHSNIWALTDGLHASSTHMETHEVIGVPPHPLGATQVYCLENKGRPPCPPLLRILFIIMALMDLIRPLGGPYDMHRLLFDLLRGLLFYSWASLGGFSPKVN